MDFQSYTYQGVSFLVIKNLYTKDELFLIQKELDYLWYSMAFNRSEDYLSVAKTDDGTVLGKRSGVWLDYFYSNRESSNILRLNRKPFANEEIRNTFANLNPYHYHYLKLDFDNTLLQYYENSDYYKPHTDHAVFSLVTWFFKEPKKFIGGKFKFTDMNFELEIENNMCIIFPSFLWHEVEEVTVLEKNKHEPHGRFSMTQFVTYDPKK